MSLPKAKPFPIAPRRPWLAAMLQTCPVILAINWVFQGMRGMDRGELAFRLGLELLLALALAPVLSWFPALLVAHSFNFSFNGQLWVCARYCRRWNRDPAALDRFLERMAAELRSLPWLAEAVCIGSRGSRPAAAGPRSDIDLRLIAPRGFLGWLRINLLLLELRTRALVELIPLDLYAYDDPTSLERFRQDEPLLVILDRHERIARCCAHRNLVTFP